MIKYYKHYYRLLHCEALRAFFKPYFFLSFTRGSLFKYPDFLTRNLNSGSCSTRARARPCLIASACPDTPPPLVNTDTLNFSSILILRNGAFAIVAKSSVGKYFL